LGGHDVPFADSTNKHYRRGKCWVQWICEYAREDACVGPGL